MKTTKKEREEFRELCDRRNYKHEILSDEEEERYLDLCEKTCKENGTPFSRKLFSRETTDMVNDCIAKCEKLLKKLGIE